MKIVFLHQIFNQLMSMHFTIFDIEILQLDGILMREPVSFQRNFMYLSDCFVFYVYLSEAYTLLCL